MPNKRKTTKIGGGRGGKHKPTISNNKPKEPEVERDECHNEETPCCALVEQIVYEIFPEAKTIKNEEEEKTVEETKDKKQSSSNDTTTTTTGTLSEVDKSCLLSEILRFRLLERRKMLRGMNGQLDDGNTSTKKKRKRKKKKGTAKVENSTAAADEVDAEENSNTAPGQQSEQTSKPIKDAAAPNVDKCSNVDNKVGEQEAVVQEPVPETIVPLDTSTSTTQNKSGPPASHIDRFLDRILDQSPSPITVPTAIKNRDLSSFVLFLSQHFQEAQTEIKKKSNSQKKKSKTPTGAADSSALLDDDKTVPSIPIKEITKQCQSIKCIQCKRSAENFVQLSCIMRTSLDVAGGNTTTSSSDSDKECIILGNMPDHGRTKSQLSVPQFGKAGRVNEDDPYGDPIPGDFDYVDAALLMEEGKGDMGNTEEEEKNKQASPKMALSLFPVADDKGRKQGLKVKCDTDGKDTNNDAVYPLGAEDLECLIRHIILPCGLHEMDIVEEEVDEEHKLTEAEFKSICMEVEKEVTDLIRDINSAGSELRSLHTEYNQLIPKVGEAFDVKSTATLMSCDKRSNELLVTLVSILMKVTKIYHSLLSLGAVLDVAKEVMEKLWYRYDRTMGDLLHCSQIHEGKVLNLANRPGAVPQMFVDASHRSSFRDMLGTKLGVLGSFFEDIKCELLNFKKPDGQIPNFLTILSTHERFYSENDGQIESANLTELDRCCNDLLSIFHELTQTVHSGNVRGIFDTQQKRLNRLRDGVEDLDKHIMSVYSLISEDLRLKYSSSWNEMRKQHNRLQSQCKSADYFGNDHMSDDFLAGKLAPLRNTIELLVQNSLKEWRFVRSLKTRPFVLRQKGERRLPQRLESWMRNPEEGHETPSKANIEQRCQGGGGMRRVHAILAGLLYRWLCDRCMEWHAELTQSELLDSMEAQLDVDGFDQSITNSSTTQGTKSGKKKKKKKDKKKNNGSTGQVSEVSPNKELAASNSALDKKDTEESKDESSGLEKESNVDIDESSEEISGKDEEGSSIQENENQSEENNIEEVDAFSADSTFDRDHLIGVLDHRGGYETAEEFLCGRLKVILNDSNVIIL
mmetsp:Transcript_12143/g.17290  ORF Transcript_12143/g.17290 Transcript_12143/m.17290 type:complete len:1082 (-) Transcript_12143:3940-7185(-)